jgi:hypothetical protein
MKNIIKQYVTVAIACNVLIACAGTGAPNELGRDVNYSASDCISIRTIRDYTPLDKSTLLIEGAGKRTYLVQLLQPAIELRSSYGIGFSSRDDWLCPYGGDEIVIESLSRERLRIRSISHLSDEQVEDVLIRYGKKDPDTEQAPVPADEIKGAEVEELG